MLAAELEQRRAQLRPAAAGDSLGFARSRLVYESRTPANLNAEVVVDRARLVVLGGWRLVQRFGMKAGCMAKPKVSTLEVHLFMRGRWV